MAVNNFTFNQLATVLNSVRKQATGETALAAVDESSFVTVAQDTLKTAGYDFVMSAISQVLSKTIFSVRPYSRKFGGLMVNNITYGNHVRKLQVIDTDFENEAKYSLTDGVAVDQFVVNKPKVLQTNFYGENVFMKSLTIFKDQLDVAFSSSEEFGRFISMVMQNVADMIEQSHEAVARATLGNFINGKCVGDTGNVIHLLTEYNTATGLALTATTVMQPVNFMGFVRWAYARIASLSQLMTERTIKYHMNYANKNIARHTPKADQKLYLYAPILEQIKAMVLSGLYNDELLSLADVEGVSFWQAIGTPQTINSLCIFPDTVNGGLKTSDDGQTPPSPAAHTQANIVGVLFDREAVGYTVINESVDMSPYNAKGKYWNQYWHFVDRYWNDFTENGIVFILD